MSTINLNTIAVSANGTPVYSHPESHSHRPDLNAEVISKIVLPEDNTFYRNTIDIGRVVGKDHLVETDKDDIIVYLRRGNRPGESRMVLKPADDTSFVTIIACVAQEGDDTPAELVGKWVLVTLFEGKQGEREPFDKAFADGKNPEGLEKAEEFWETHALVPTEEELKQIIEKEYAYLDRCEKWDCRRLQEELTYKITDKARALLKEGAQK